MDIELFKVESSKAKVRRWKRTQCGTVYYVFCIFSIDKHFNIAKSNGQMVAGYFLLSYRDKHDIWFYSGAYGDYKKYLHILLFSNEVSFYQILDLIFIVSSF